MYEGTIPLKDFLDTMNRLQADFERRLGGIEHDVPPTSPHSARARETTGLPPSWRSGELTRPLGIEAVWTDARRGEGERSDRPEEPFSARYPDPFLD
ncbi:MULTISPECIES: hypothetical protein [unclassified Streptomyces]|uniref:hypothetical protein n=1 Tax=unclassified Streptomyces TaxID=2593676 RepID=UPI0006AF6523|nr:MULTISPECIES: hypothetical protein [unclassified Streptomyces]KOX36373.1 hypothetical protein ADL06_05095 [Streptomyces sp. NRRL F-6491]KOX51493.1 hypothetical protein ADL08_03895 [Streptomyces sp. NRRL F-6492]